ncbi:methyl-accepting chemotaxis sensory transducer [Isosphaera pallida ATCC 43644]|uniref:Methyl-accepting chemotaxis sensory transducer n=2 Tax=Isosphaera pallida TaxID=128 RepID=E8R1Z0_ISOPI|nr:methyl-accepting chemotaxis sensory transducer [Isosphaera pallida ATCC 43644]
MRQSVTFMGGVAGGMIALLAWVLPSLFSASMVGGLAGVGLGIALGAGIGLVASQASREAMLEALRSLRKPGTPPPSSGVEEFDELIGEFREELLRWKRVRDDVELAEQVARDLTGVGTAARADGAAITLLLTEIATNANHLLEELELLLDSSNRAATAAEQIEEPLSRTLETLDALFNNTQSISNNTALARRDTDFSSREIRRGLDQVQAMKEGMEKIEELVADNSGKIKRLSMSSIEISTIIEDIAKISSKTENLATNAKLAATRAREHGQEFSNIADEFRELSEKTADATNNIGERVRAIQAETQEISRAFEDELGKVEREANRVREANEALNRINEMSQRSANLVEGINRAVAEQVNATKDVLDDMKKVIKINEQTTTELTHARRHVEALARRCEQLRRLGRSEALRNLSGTTFAKTKSKGIGGFATPSLNGPEVEEPVAAPGATSSRTQSPFLQKIPGM